MSTQTRGITPRRIVLMVIVILLFAMTPLIISGQWDWLEAWAYALVSIVGFAASRLLAARRNPGLIEERARSMELEGAKSWDRILAPLVALGSVLIPVSAGFDKLYGWTTPFPAWAKITAFVILILGYLVGTWALLENKFFSGVVRIQKDRGHTAVSSGPYAWVRHPGYAGSLWVFWAIPVLLDSVWAFIPSVFFTIVLIVRTALEDKTLQTELPGYREFAQKTRYRLLPGIW